MDAWMFSGANHSWNTAAGSSTSTRRMQIRLDRKTMINTAAPVSAKTCQGKKNDMIGRIKSSSRPNAVARPIPNQ